MNLKAMRWLVLLAMVFVLAGCSGTGETTDADSPLTPVPSNQDESHGWGTNIRGN